MTLPQSPLPARYHDVAFLAEGAFGQVFRARLADGRAVAVKVLSATWLGDPDALWRFNTEFRRLNALRSEAFPSAIEEGLTEEGRPFYAMSLLEGAPPAPDRPLAPDEVRRVLAELAAALVHLHGVGLVHGDLKDENVLIVSGGPTHLLDVGTAGAIGQRRESVAGTLEYMAPEVLRQADLAPEADWYALGVLGYRLLTGRPPFVAGEGGPAALVRSQLLEAPRALPAALQAEAPALASAVMSLLDKDPGARRASLPQVFSALGLSPALAGGGGLRGGTWLPRAEVTEAWARMSAGEAVVVVGPPGAGKSRALDALRLEAMLAGQAWVGVRCGGAGEAPGGVARAVLRQALAAGGLPPSPVVAEWLRGAMPEAWLELEPRARGLSLRRALAETWTVAIAASGGLVVGLDDWPEADPTSRELLWHLARLPGAHGARWCLTATEQGERPDGVAVVSLKPWTGAAIAELVASRLGEPAPAALGAALASANAEWPGLVNALVEHWQASGALSCGPAGWAFTPPERSPHAGNDPWRELWADVRARLTPDQRWVAAIAATFRAAGPIPPPTLAQGVDLAPHAFDEAVDALLAAGVLVRGEAGVRFAPLPEPESWAEELPDAARPALATRLARALLGPLADDGAVPTDEALGAVSFAPLVTAAVLAASGDDDPLAISLAGVAARRALEHLSFEDARRLLTLARARLSEQVPATRRLALTLVSAEVARLTDRTDDGIADFTEALALARGLGDDPGIATSLLGLAKGQQLKGTYDQAREHAALAEAAASRAGLPGLAARACVMQARIELFVGAGLGTARASCARAVALAGSHAPAMRASALNLQGALWVQEDPGARDAALALIREALALADGIGDVMGVAAALENLGNAHSALGELREALDAFTRDAELCQSHGIATEGLSADMNRALVLAELGECEDALALSADVVERAQARPFIRAVALAVGGQAAARAARPEEASAALDAAVALAEGIKNRLAEEYIRLYRVEAAHLAGDLTGARVEAAAVATLVEANDHAEGRAKLALHAAALALAEGDLAGAREAAQPIADGPNHALAHAAHGLLGRVHALAGRPAEAWACLERALATARDWRAPWHIAAARLALARLAAQPEEALAQAREALAPGPNLFARAGAACLLAELGAAEPSAGRALADLEDALASLSPERRDRVLAGQGLPDAETLAGMRERLALVRPLARAGIDVVVAWHEAIVSAHDERRVHEELLAGLSAIAATERGYLLGYERGRLQEVVTLGVDYAEEVAQGFSSTIAEEVLLSGEPLYLIDAAADDRWRAASSVQTLGLRTVVALPFATSRQVLGVIYLDRPQVEPLLGEGDLAALGLLARTAAERVAALRREAELEDALDHERGVADAALAMALAPDALARRQALLQAAMAVTGADRAFWLRRNDDGDGWQALAGRDADGASLTYAPERVSQSVVARTATERMPLCLVETDRPDDWTPGQSVLTLGIRMIWCVPADAAGDEVLYLDSPRLRAVDPHGPADRLNALLERLLPTRR